MGGEANALGKKRKREWGNSDPQSKSSVPQEKERYPNTLVGNEQKAGRKRALSDSREGKKKIKKHRRLTGKRQLKERRTKKGERGREKVLRVGVERQRRKERKIIVFSLFAR